MSDPTFLDVRGLCVSYGRRQVLFDVGLAARPRGAVAVLGRNGAGKTTLLRTIVGELEARSGSIMLGARDITRMPTERRIRMGLGYVPQEHSVFGRLSVRENLAVGALSSPGSSPVDQVLTMFPKLGQRLGQPAGTLSGGERKMLAIGRALLSNPKLLLLDEPTEGVWVGVIEEIASASGSSSRKSPSSSLSSISIWRWTWPTTLTSSVALEGRSSAVRNDSQLLQLLTP